MFYVIIEKNNFFLAVNKTRRHNGFIQIVFKISTIGI